MIRDEEHLLALTDAFHSAAVGAQSWHGALEGLAKATGSRSGQLIGLASDAAVVPFNLITNIDLAFHEDFVAAGGADPGRNPRVRVAAAAPALKVLAEADYLTDDEYVRHPYIQQIASRWDVAFSCLTALERRDGLLVRLAVLRSREEGHITTPQREAFAALAPHARAAVRTHLSLEGQGAVFVSGAMESLSMAAFVCDRFASVRALTPAAEALVTSARGLQLANNKLRALNPAAGRELESAITAAASVRPPTAPLRVRTVVVPAANRHDVPLVLDVVELPVRYYDFGFAPRVLVIARGQADDERRKMAIIGAAFDLTAAETDIAVQLSRGRNAEFIAAGRGVAVGTVRAQIKTLLGKLGVKSQLELVAKLNKI